MVTCTAENNNIELTVNNEACAVQIASLLPVYTSSKRLVQNCLLLERFLSFFWTNKKFS